MGDLCDKRELQNQVLEYDFIPLALMKMKLIVGLQRVSTLITEIFKIQ